MDGRESVIAGHWRLAQSLRDLIVIVGDPDAIGNNSAQLQLWLIVWTNLRFLTHFAI
jgi:hypothetical protein